MKARLDAQYACVTMLNNSGHLAPRQHDGNHAVGGEQRKRWKTDPPLWHHNYLQTVVSLRKDMQMMQTLFDAEMDHLNTQLAEKTDCLRHDAAGTSHLTTTQP